MLKTDVCVVGAGPAGTIASLFLSKNEVPHILIERASFPREKVCGEFYDGRLRSILNQINPSLIQQMKDRNVIQDIRRYTYINSELKALDIQIPLKTTPRISTNRYDFDNYLLEEALKSKYIQYIDKTNISEVTPTEGGVTLCNATKSVAVQAKTAIIATGSNSPLAQKLVPQNRGAGHFLLVARGYYRNIAKTNDENVTQIYCFRQPLPYYLCIVHLPNNLATVEIGVLKSVVSKYQVSPENLLVNVVKEHPEIKKIFTHATLEGKIKGAAAPKTSGKHPISAQRIMLAGSSGSSVNILTGWGVGHAAFEAMCAVNQYVINAKNNDFSAQAFKEYDKKVHKALGRDRFLGQLADYGLFYCYPFLDFSLGFIAQNAWLSRKIGDLIISL